MRRLLTSLFFILVAYLHSISQDGKIIEKKIHFIADTTIAKFEKLNPDIRTILDAVNLYSITYLSDGLKVKGYMATPKAEGHYPCIIFNRGGNRDSGVITDFTLIRFFAEVAKWGYVVVGSNYRGNAGGEGTEEFGGREVNDILNLIPLLSQVELADTSRLGMYGWSRGGMMTYLALTKTTRMKAAIIGSGMADAFMMTTKRPEMDSVFAELAPGYHDNRDSLLQTRSAVKWADKICKTTPLLLLCGSADWRVSPEEQLRMLNQLYAVNHPVRFEFLEGGSHGLSEHYTEVNRSVKNFLDYYVRDINPLPNLEPHGK